MRFILLLLAVAGSAAAVPVQRPLRSGPVTLSLKAVESGMQTSEGGHDDWSSDRSVYYYVNLGVGTPPQTLEMLFDTGSTKTLIFDTRCSVPNCSTDKAKFDTTMSSTFQRTSIAARNGYSTGQTYWGEWVKDIVSLGGRSVCNYTFQAIDPSDVHDDSLWGSGILGASWTYAAGDIGSSLLRTIVDGMEDKRFGLYLSRLDSDSDSDITRPRSELTLGGAATSKYDGELHTTAIYLDPGGKPRGWWIPLDGLVFGNKTIAIPPASQALVDSGTPTIDMPVEFVREFYSGIAGAVEDDGVWTFPCDSPGINLTVTVGGHEFPIYWGDLARPLYEGAAVCRGAVEENVAEGGDPDGANFCLGATFLKNVYSVFSYEPPEVAFGVLRDEHNNINSPSLLEQVSQ